MAAYGKRLSSFLADPAAASQTPARRRKGRALPLRQVLMFIRNCLRTASTHVTHSPQNVPHSLHPPMSDLSSRPEGAVLRPPGGICFFSLFLELSASSVHRHPVCALGFLFSASLRSHNTPSFQAYPRSAVCAPYASSGEVRFHRTFLCDEISRRFSSLCTLCLCVGLSFAFPISPRSLPPPQRPKNSPTPALLITSSSPAPAAPSHPTDQAQIPRLCASPRRNFPPLPVSTTQKPTGEKGKRGKKGKKKKRKKIRDRRMRRCGEFELDRVWGEDGAAGWLEKRDVTYAGCGGVLGALRGRKKGGEIGKAKERLTQRAQSTRRRKATRDSSHKYVAMEKRTVARTKPRGAKPRFAEVRLE